MSKIKRTRHAVPTYTKQIPAKASPEQIERWQAQAKADGVSFAQYVRTAVDEYTEAQSEGW